MASPFWYPAGMWEAHGVRWEAYVQREEATLLNVGGSDSNGSTGSVKETNAQWYFEGPQL